MTPLLAPLDHARARDHEALDSEQVNECLLSLLLFITNLAHTHSLQLDSSSKNILARQPVSQPKR